MSPPPPRCLSHTKLQQFSDDVGSLCVPHHIDKLDCPPDHFTFLRDFVWPSRPCIIRKAILNAQSYPLVLTLDDLISISQNPESTRITVDVTPDGRGDCVRSVKVGHAVQKMFVKPLQVNMTLTTFQSELRKQTSSSSPFSSPYTDSVEVAVEEEDEDENVQQIDSQGLAIHSLTKNKNIHPITTTSLPKGVYYYSLQNNCLCTEWPSLYHSNLFPSTFAFAQDAFGTGPPQAINLWIGNSQAVSAMHKDPFENLFYVLSGEKIFTLCPPADVVFIPQDDFQSASFVWEDESLENRTWKILPDSPRQDVPWIEPDPCLQKSHVLFPSMKHIHRMQVHVQQGELLYLPALWYHRVTQSCETVGLNYWYDMRYDTPLWSWFNLHQHVS